MYVFFRFQGKKREIFWMSVYVITYIYVNSSLIWKKKQYSNIVFIYYTLKKLGAYESWSVQFFSYSEFSTIWLMNCLEIIAWSRLTWLRSSNERKKITKKNPPSTFARVKLALGAREQIAIKTTHRSICIRDMCSYIENCNNFWYSTHTYFNPLF